jgi:hypothetical protein
MKKIVIPGIVAAIASLAATFALNYLFPLLWPSLTAEYENSGMFRPWSDPLMSLFFTQPFLLAMAMAWIWDKTKQLFKGSLISNAFSFTLISFFVSNLPGMIMSYSSFKISLVMTLCWTISGFVQIFVAMLVIGKMNK